MPTPTGTVSGYINGINNSNLGPATLDSNGNATLSGTVPALPAGSYSAAVQYSGDANYPAAGATISFTVGGIATVSGTASYNESTSTLTITVNVAGS